MTQACHQRPQCEESIDKKYKFCDAFAGSQSMLIDTYFKDMERGLVGHTGGCKDKSFAIIDVDDRLDELRGNR